MCRASDVDQPRPICVRRSSTRLQMQPTGGERDGGAGGQQVTHVGQAVVAQPQDVLPGRRKCAAGSWRVRATKARSEASRKSGRGPCRSDRAGPARSGRVQAGDPLQGRLDRAALGLLDPVLGEGKGQAPSAMDRAALRRGLRPHQRLGVDQGKALEAQPAEQLAEGALERPGSIATVRVWPCTVGGRTTSIPVWAWMARKATSTGACSKATASVPW